MVDNEVEVEVVEVELFIVRTTQFSLEAILLVYEREEIGGLVEGLLMYERIPLEGLYMLIEVDLEVTLVWLAAIHEEVVEVDSKQIIVYIGVLEKEQLDKEITEERELDIVVVEVEVENVEYEEMDLTP